MQLEIAITCICANLTLTRTSPLFSIPLHPVCFGQELTRSAILMTKAEKQEQLRTTSWWLPQFQPEAVKEKVELVRSPQ